MAYLMARLCVVSSDNGRCCDHRTSGDLGPHAHETNSLFLLLAEATSQLTTGLTRLASATPRVQVRDIICSPPLHTHT